MFENTGSPKIEVPQGSKPIPGEAQIFAMPEKFRGLAAKVNPPVIKPAVIPLPPPKPLPPPPKVIPKIGTKRDLSKMAKAIIIASACLVLVLGSAGAYVYFSLKPITKQINTAVNNSVKANNSVNAVKPANTANQANTATNSAVVSPFPNNSQPGRDTDSDGLTDAEELLYHTSSKKPDTDSDGFLDGNEVFHGYDPNAAAPAKLSDSDIVKLFQADSYSLYFPTAWTATLDAKTNGVVFTIPSGETITLSWEEKTEGIELAQWFSGVNPGADIKVAAGLTKQNFPFLTTEDQMTYYIDIGNQVAILNYQNTVKSTVDYLATFEMMMNSLKYAESGVE